MIQAAHQDRSGCEALTLVAEVRPDVVLLDLMIPDLDGPKTIRLLREVPEAATIPVVVLTAKVQARDRSQLETLGIRGLITRPCDPLTLASEVEAQVIA